MLPYLYISYKSSNNYNQNAVLSYEVNERSNIRITENDYVYIYLLVDTKLNDDAGIWLTEDWFKLVYSGRSNSNKYVYECDVTNLFVVGDNFYKTQHVDGLEDTPKRFAKVFLNYFGSCEFFFDSGDPQALPIYIGKIEVTSSKISESDIDNIFDFLLGNKTSYWQAISRAKVKAAENILYDGHLFLLLYQLQLDLNVIRKLLPQFEVDPRTHLVKHSSVEDWNENLTINEDSILWLLQNCHVIERADHYHADRVRIKNQFYRITQIQAEYLLDKTDTYENKIIHGYLHDIQNFLFKKKLELDRIIELQPTSSETLKEIQTIKYYNRLAQNTQLLLNSVDQILYYCQNVIPVSQPLLEFPSYFQGFESKDHYYQLWQKIVKWLSRQTYTYDSNFLFSGVRTLDKLYELFCLFKILNVLEEIGFQKIDFLPNPTQSKEIENSGSNHSGKYTLRNQDIIINLFYEQLPKYLFTSSSLYRGQLLPDFVLDISKEGANYTHVIILDAKYKPLANIKKYDVPDLTLKYLHGLNTKNRNLKIKALFLLHPKDKKAENIEDSIWFYQKEKYNLFSEYPISPSIGTVEVGVGKHDHAHIGIILSKSISIFEKQFETV